jgi:hypothetical protein
MWCGSRTGTDESRNKSGNVAIGAGYRCGRESREKLKVHSAVLAGRAESRWVGGNSGAFQYSARLLPPRPGSSQNGISSSVSSVAGSCWLPSLVSDGSVVRW